VSVKIKPPWLGGTAYPFRETRHTVGVRLMFDLSISGFRALSIGN